MDKNTMNRYNMKSLIIAVLSLLAISCQHNSFSNLEYLEGTWKVEDKESYEVWERVSTSELKGYSYKLIDEEKKISETLQIVIENGSIVYRATVPNQNEGATVSFTLNESIDSCFSFENKKHDFPQKIQYKKFSEQEIHINVLGEDNKGFSFSMVKEETID